VRRAIVIAYFFAFFLDQLHKICCAQTMMASFVLSSGFWTAIWGHEYAEGWIYYDNLDR